MISQVTIEQSERPACIPWNAGLTA